MQRKNKLHTSKKAFTLVELILSLTILALAVGIVGAAMTSGLQSWSRGQEMCAKNLRRQGVSEELRRSIASMLPYIKFKTKTGKIVPVLPAASAQNVRGNEEFLLVAEERRIGFVVADENFRNDITKNNSPVWVEFYVDAQRGLMMKRVPLTKLYNADGDTEVILLDEAVRSIKFAYHYLEYDEDDPDAGIVYDSDLNWPLVVTVTIKYDDQTLTLTIPIRAGMKF